MNTRRIAILTTISVLALALDGCSAPPIRYYDPGPKPLKAPKLLGSIQPAVNCTGTAECANAPDCGECGKCIPVGDKFFCNYRPKATVAGENRTCDCFNGQVEFCYLPVEGALRLGTRKCKLILNSTSYTWDTCTVLP